jgi:hypothetical protein
MKKPPARGLPGGVPVVREAEALEEAIGVDLIYLSSYGTLRSGEWK